MDQIAAFDTLFTNNHIQICKLLLPTLPKDKQYLLAILIKLWELDYVIRHGRQISCPSTCDDGKSPDYQKLCRDILPYCSKKESGMVQSILQMLNTLDTVKSLSPLLELVKQMQTSTDGDDSKGPSMPDIGSLLSMGDLLGGSISPEMMGMFDSLFHAAENTENEPAVPEHSEQKPANSGHSEGGHFKGEQETEQRQTDRSADFT